MVQIAACTEGIPAHAWSVAMLSPLNLYQVASLQLAELLHFLRKRTSSKAFQSHYKDMDSHVFFSVTPTQIGGRNIGKVSLEDYRQKLEKTGKI